MLLGLTRQSSASSNRFLSFLLREPGLFKDKLERRCCMPETGMACCVFCSADQGQGTPGKNES